MVAKTSSNYFGKENSDTPQMKDNGKVGRNCGRFLPAPVCGSRRRGGKNNRESYESWDDPRRVSAGFLTQTQQHCTVHTSQTKVAFEAHERGLHQTRLLVHAWHKTLFNKNGQKCPFKPAHVSSWQFRFSLSDAEPLFLWYKLKSAGNWRCAPPPHNMYTLCAAGRCTHWRVPVRARGRQSRKLLQGFNRLVGHFSFYLCPLNYWKCLRTSWRRVLRTL